MVDSPYYRPPEPDPVAPSDPVAPPVRRVRKTRRTGDPDAAASGLGHLPEPIGSRQPDDDYFFLRSRMDIEMPNASSRTKDRAARRELAALDGRPISERPDQPPVNGCRRPMIVGMCVVLAMLAGLLVLAIASGQG